MTAPTRDGGWVYAVRDWVAALAIGFAAYVAAEWITDREPVGDGDAPALLLDTPEGETVDLESFRGSTVIVNFWGTWCPPCRREIPEFSAFARKHPDVQVLGVAVRSGEGANLRRESDKLGIAYTVLEGDEASTRAWGVDVFPTTFVVDPHGHIAKVYAGAIGRAQLDAALASLH